MGAKNRILCIGVQHSGRVVMIRVMNQRWVWGADDIEPVYLGRETRRAGDAAAVRRQAECTPHTMVGTTHNASKRIMCLAYMTTIWPDLMILNSWYVHYFFYSE